MDALGYVKELGLEPHPEGGWYKEVHRSEGKFDGDGEFPNGRNFLTSIYFLLEKNNFSAFHKIKSDESWHFYAGDPIELFEITDDGILNTILIGNDISKGHVFQYTVKAGFWFASRVYQGGEFALAGCTVAPGFDFRDFEMAERKELLAVYPQHEGVILMLTR